MPINESHERYLDVLFTRAAAGRYPSHRILGRIEAATTDRRTAERYVELLLAEAESQRYPSLQMLDRAGRMMKKVAVADVLEHLRRDMADADARQANEGKAEQ